MSLQVAEDSQFPFKLEPMQSIYVKVFFEAPAGQRVIIEPFTKTA